MTLRRCTRDEWGSVKGDLVDYEGHVEIDCGGNVVAIMYTLKKDDVAFYAGLPDTPRYPEYRPSDDAATAAAKLRKNPRMPSEIRKAGGPIPPKMVDRNTRLKTSETGLRTRVTAMIAYDAGHDKFPYAFISLERNLNAKFGGFTHWSATGGWREEDGSDLIEWVRVYSVPMVPGKANSQLAIDLFQKAGRALDQEWVHIEVDHYLAARIRCNAPETRGNVVDVEA